MARSDAAARAALRAVRRSPRWWTSRRGSALGAVVVFAVALVSFPQVDAAFFGTTTNTGNALSAAATFPTYPSSVVADSPLFYHRVDDTPGAVTATDTSGNGRPGVYGTSNVTAWTGLWPMDENTGATAKDVSAAATTHDLTRSGASWTASGVSGSALSFNGTSDYAITGSSAVTTTASFTVTAWVYLTDTSVSRTAVSQDGANVSGFELGYDQSINRWAFSMPRSDSTLAIIDKAISTAAPVEDTWVQLTAMFNSTSTGIDLYVNGVQQTSSTHTAGNTWAATGALQVGAATRTSRTNFWEGSIDNVRVHSIVVNAATTRELTLGSTGGPATSWPFDETSGSTTVDHSGNLNTGTLGSAASWTTGRNSTNAVYLPGDTSGNGYVSGAAAGVTTSASFSVAAWVYLDNTTLGAMSRVAVSQSGSVKSGFMLRYNHYVTQWDFAVNTGAADDYVAVFDRSTSAGLAVLNTWTHLVGVYDAVAQTVTLYVNGVAQTPAAHTSLFNATGPLQAGRVKEFGTWQVGTAGQEAWGPWAGRVEDVRAYRRALTSTNITALYSGGNAGNTLGTSGALQGAQQGQTGSTAQAYAATARSSYNPISYANPTTYSLECWFRTNGVSGAVQGQTLMSFGNKSSGNSTASDRRLFLDTSGRLVAGTNSGTLGMARTTGTYLDGGWHHAVATVHPTNGIKLYVDGSLAASAAYAAPGNYTGYWRWGGDTWSGSWPADYYWLGSLDELAVYSTELTAQQVARHYYANH